MAVEIVSFVNEGLGHSSYLVDLGDGTALVIDPARIPTAQVAHAAERGLRIAYTADTHTHADYISGSPDLAMRGAVFLAPAAAGLDREYRGLTDGDLVDVGRYRLEAVATPGHTPDHLAYLLSDDAGPVALFSGGSLMVGTVGRTDLLGDEHREALAHDLYRALRDRILTLPDDLAVYPTHGAGSFCSAPGGGDRASTIGRERATNPLLSMDEDDFVERLLAGLGSFPDYFRLLPSVNQHGLPLHDDVPALAPLGLDAVDRLLADGAVVVDARKVVDFAAGHAPDAVNIELGALPEATVPDGPVATMCGKTERAMTAASVLERRGHRDVGALRGGYNAWTAHHQATTAR